MTIGGTDIIIPGTLADWGFVVEHMARAWPDGWLEAPSDVCDLGAFSHKMLTLCGIPENLAQARPAELFVYRKPGSRNADDMIHVLFGECEITFVVGHRESEAGAVVERLRRALTDRASRLSA